MAIINRNAGDNFNKLKIVKHMQKQLRRAKLN